MSANKIPLSVVREALELLDLKEMVVYGIDSDGFEHVLTQGESEGDARRAAEKGNNLKRDYLNWPEELCNAKPLQRICKNCREWIAPLNDEKHGTCLFTLFAVESGTKESRTYPEDSCKEFYPKESVTE